MVHRRQHCAATTLPVMIRLKLAIRSSYIIDYVATLDSLIVLQKLFIIHITHVKPIAHKLRIIRMVGALRRLGRLMRQLLPSIRVFHNILRLYGAVLLNLHLITPVSIVIQSCLWPLLM